jgi:hypothetical protein
MFSTLSPRLGAHQGRRRQMINFRTPKGTEITIQADGTNGLRVRATAGGKIAMDEAIAALTIGTNETPDTGRKCRVLKVGERFIEIDTGQEAAIRDLMKAVVAQRQEAERAAWLASPQGQAETERQRKERAYDAIHNEGAYGYNPHRGGDRPTYWPAEDRRERHYPDGA